MHICLLSPSYLPVVDGGVPIASGRLTASLLRKGHRVTVLTVPPVGGAVPPKNLSAQPGFRLYYRLIEAPRQEPAATTELCTWTQQLHQQDPFDVMLAYFVYPSGYLATILGEALGIPVVCSCRGSDISTGVFDAPDLTIRVLQRCSALIFVSAFLLRMADTLEPCRSKATVVPNAVDSTRFAPALIPPDTDRQRLTLGTCGLLRWKKGLDLFLPLIRNLCATHDVQILIAGHGLYESDERQIAHCLDQYGLHDRVNVTGPLPHDDIVHALRRMDIYINTSYQEGMPNGMLEAMACALPVIATDAGDNASLVADGVTGYICPQGDLTALTQKCHTLLAQPALRQQMGWAGRRRIQQYFDPDREVEAVEAILERIPSSNPAPGWTGQRRPGDGTRV